MHMMLGVNVLPCLSVEGTYQRQLHGTVYVTTVESSDRQRTTP